MTHLNAFYSNLSEDIPCRTRYVVNSNKLNSYSQLSIETYKETGGVASDLKLRDQAITVDTILSISNLLFETTSYDITVAQARINCLSILSKEILTRDMMSPVPKRKRAEMRSNVGEKVKDVFLFKDSSDLSSLMSAIQVCC